MNCSKYNYLEFVPIILHQTSRVSLCVLETKVAASAKEFFVESQSYSVLYDFNAARAEHHSHSRAQHHFWSEHHFGRNFTNSFLRTPCWQRNANELKDAPWERAGWAEVLEWGWQRVVRNVSNVSSRCWATWVHERFAIDWEWGSHIYDR